jgi:recombinase-like zinc beta ribbon protein
VRDWQDYNAVNTEIKASLGRPETRARFALMNNGVTVIAKTLRATGNKFRIEDSWLRLFQGKPRFGSDSKYMLIGLGECAVCHGGLQARLKRDFAYYECGTSRQKGKAVCPNRHSVRMELADRAVLSMVEQQLFGAGVVRHTVEHLAARLAETGATASTERTGLQATATKLA